MTSNEKMFSAQSRAFNDHLFKLSNVKIFIEAEKISGIIVETLIPSEMHNKFVVILPLRLLKHLYSFANPPESFSCYLFSFIQRFIYQRRVKYFISLKRLSGSFRFNLSNISD